ncbi:MAG: hypothetical protein KJO08_11355, partial [Gammaproteobacteria bacterium]|nr:hypothetical protein [Gammaproteobacteria bacterium]
MSLTDKVRINTHYTRSINLERDGASEAVARAYIPTSMALRILGRMVDALEAYETPRAWSLVGPYGSGKSSYAIFLAHLLGNPGERATKATSRILAQNKDNAELVDKFISITQAGEGYCTVLITGSPESLARRLVQTLAEKAKKIWVPREQPAPSVVEKLEKLAAQSDHPSTSDILDCIQELQSALAAIWYSGLLIVIDELGKFLEYEVRHGDSITGSSDIYLLQALAEHALSPHNAKLAVIVMLHQAFEQYARGLGESLKNEWAKIQGRFENIPFLESSEQTLRVVATAIEHDFTAPETRKIRKEAEQFAQHFAKAEALPGAMDVKMASKLFEACYPLHPISALLLPILCQKVAQNERTLFSYLGSRESFGFQDALGRYENIGEWIYPWEIYEYFILNQPAALSDHFTHRRWLEVVTAIERLGDAPDAEITLLKTIGLLNIVGAQGNFKASKQLLAKSLPTQGAVDNAIEGLTKKSIIHYRKFSAEYRVWQGSDFDIETQVKEAITQLGAFNLAERLNARHALLPVVARRYTIKSGALRYFLPVFADASNYQKMDKRSQDARIIFYLAENAEDETVFLDKVIGSFSELDILVLYRHSTRLRERLAESLALEEIQRSAQVLHTDPVAKREFTDRYAVAIAKEEEQISFLIDEPASEQWFHQGEKLGIGNKRALQ